MKTLSPYLSIISTIIVGVLFVVSAVLKMQSIDSFELYIFSFEIVSLNVASIVARVVIGAELMLGLGYLLNIYHKEFFYTILTSLILFTLFLVAVILIGREDNCHCFGDLVDISPVGSIFKNIAMLVALLFSRNIPSWQFSAAKELQSYALLTLCAIALYPAMKYPPRAISNLKGGNSGVGSVNIELFNEFIAENPQYEWGSKTKIVLFYGVGCSYCKYSAEQLSHIIRRNKLNYDSIELIFWGDDDGVASFLEQTNAVDFNYSIIPPKELLDITGGKIPTMILFDDTSASGLQTRTIKSIDERDFIQLLE